MNSSLKGIGSDDTFCVSEIIRSHNRVIVFVYGILSTYFTQVNLPNHTTMCDCVVVFMYGI